jgi:putative membrane-bound dehydrogenase-like protein
MRRMSADRLAITLLGTALLGGVVLQGETPPRTGPETEKRFPPLQLPAGFKATLFACDPLIEYPSVIAAGPRPGSLFVAVDYMTGLGTEIVRRSEIRLIEDTDGDGYADKATVFAGGFNSIQGLAYHAGTVYVMHAPFLTALRDTKGTGVADERRDLLSGLGLPPEKNPPRLHCANGVVPGHDGWLYLALGDHGCDVQRPEGDRLVLEGGGILRCRPNGRDLHIFATGLRNIYDVALDEDSNVFVRDNENDGGTYMIRVCHSFFGADHGYPYLYEERPDEALPPLADLGLGSSAGGVCYLEPQFPAEYRGNLFFCEWGRAVMRYAPARAGSGFAPLKEVEFTAGASNDPYGFKPTDLVVQSDGALFVSDWADGQRPKRGRGRIYRITHASPAKGSPRPDPAKGSLKHWIAQLDAGSYYARTIAQSAVEHRGREGWTALQTALDKRQLAVRGRLHAVWITAQTDGPAALDALFNLAATDPEPRVRAQAVRAIADRTDAVLRKHRLDAAPGDPEVIQRLRALGRDADPRVLLEVVIALGRLRWADAPDWLRQRLTEADAPLAHAAMQTLRRSANWPAVLKLLDEPAASTIRPVALRALAGQFEPLVVDGLIDRLRVERDPARRREYADTLTRVYKKRGPLVYWGYRPAPRPANTVVWDRTEPIEQALDRTLTDPDRAVRAAVLRRMQREKVPARLGRLRPWLREDRDGGRVGVLLGAFSEYPARDAREDLAAVVVEKAHSAGNRLTALTMLAAGLDQSSEGQLLQLAGTVEDGPVLAETLRLVGKRPGLKGTPLLLDKLKSSEPDVRAAAVDALAELRTVEASEPARRLLEDREARVRRSAAAAMGILGVKPAIDALLKLAQDADSAVRRASLDSLCRLREPRVVSLAVAALADRDAQLIALRCIGELGGPDQAAAVVAMAKGNPSAEVLGPVVRLLTRWSDRENESSPRRQDLERSIATVQGLSGILVRWQSSGPLSAAAAGPAIDQLSAGKGPRGQPVFATGLESRVNLGLAKSTAPDSVWLASTDLHVAEPAAVQFLASSSGALRVWLNGRPIFQRSQAGAFRIDSERFDAALSRGANRLVVQVTAASGPVEFHVRFRRKSSVAAHETLTQAALTRPGNAERGRKLFFDAEKSQCIKCHRLRDQGERLGPELTGVGKRFSRIYLIESILEPSRTIAPSFETLIVLLKNGQVKTGVRVAETGETLTLGDNQGQKHVLAKADIEEQRPQPVSTMPDGLEKRFTEQEFVDLIAFLVSQR